MTTVQRDKRGRIVCHCGGYHFPHRRTGGTCEHSSRAHYYAATRAGLSLAERMEFLSAADLRRMFPLEIDPS